MKIVISEYSAGFADSTYPLCNAMIRQNATNQYIYLCEEGNPYIIKLNRGILPIELFRSFKSGPFYKRGGVIWLFDRCITAVRNAQRRNKLCKKECPDIVLIMLTLSSVDRFFIPKLKKHAKVFLTVHDVIVPNKSMSWNHHALKQSYDAADGLIVHSEENRRQLIEMFHIENEKIHVIHHGIEFVYNKIPKDSCLNQIGLTTLDPVLLFYGGIRESKGLDILIKALKGIKCHLIIAGSMPYGQSFDRYERMIEDNQVSCTKYIEFTNDEFRDVLFQAADFIVLPYKEFYSQSGVFMQAIHYRKPVIATDVSSFRNYVERYNMGYICRPNDVEDLRNTIKVACADKEQGVWNDCEGIERAALEHSWDESAKAYLNFLGKICNGNDGKMFMVGR